MPKRISQKEKEDMILDFFNGMNIEELSKKFSCTKITINRHLKKSIDEKKYENIIKRNNQVKKSEKSINLDRESTSPFIEKIIKEIPNSENSFSDQSFMEIAPLNYEIDNEPQKDLSSIPISHIDFPKIVYMVVNKNIELETKYLKEYVEWQFLSQEELNRKTIEIFLDLKVAKRFCSKDQKVIKVPNTNVFKLTAPFLLNKGITRIVSDDKLIAL